MIIKDVINNPWNVIIELYCNDELKIKPGEANSILNIIGELYPIDPPIKPYNICNNPIHKWFVINIIFIKGIINIIF